MAASRSERASMFCIHAGMAPSAATTPAAIAIRTTKVFARALRDNFNLHLLRADVVRNVLRGHSEPVASGWQFFRHHHSACARARVWIPAQTYRRHAFKLRDQRSRAGGGLYLQLDLVAMAVLLAVKRDLERGRLAGDDEGLCLAIDAAVAVAQHEPHAVCAVFHVSRREETRLPDIFFREITQQ